MLWSHISCFINCSGFSVNQLSIWRVDCRLELMCGHKDCKNNALKLKLKHSLLDIQHYNNIDGKRVIIIPLRLPIFLFKILPNSLFFTLFPKVMRGELFFSHLKEQWKHNSWKNGSNAGIFKTEIDHRGTLHETKFWLFLNRRRMGQTAGVRKTARALPEFWSLNCQNFCIFWNFGWCQ